ncbi:MAG: Asp-tRNA(Asn)/Glu-tRNA(Gln) amidotransferase subunit GatC [Candidatus Brocadiales bacterium]|jgi:aspartyl-tRNA(Asn)/glutamyl-tRNA(Gln) amidotransferase subunit C
MGITKKELEHIVVLSRLELNEEEKELFSRQLGDILAYIEKLNELNTEHVEPMAYAATFNNVFREDKTVPSLPQEMALQNSPSQTLGFFKVPKVLD